MTEELIYIDDKQDDSNLNVSFYQTVNENGIPVEMVKITIPGNDETVINEPVNERYKARFAKHWDAYRNVREMTGSPIEQWDISEAMIAEFKKQEFHFVEQVANAPDALLQNIMGYHSWRQKARAYLDRNRVTPEKVISAQQAQIEDLQKQVADLIEIVSQKPRRQTVKEE